MTLDEQRQAWRVYAAAALSTPRNAEYTNGDIESVEDVADRLLKAELQRFDSPDHSGDADKMVEPRPWVDLTDVDIVNLAESWVEAWHEPRGLFAASSLIRMAQHRLQAKNGGTR
jgi:hypothetical protein